MRNTDNNSRLTFFRLYPISQPHLPAHRLSFSRRDAGSEDCRNALALRSLDGHFLRMVNKQPQGSFQCLLSAPLPSCSTSVSIARFSRRSWVFSLGLTWRKGMIFCRDWGILWAIWGAGTLFDLSGRWSNRSSIACCFIANFGVAATSPPREFIRQALICNLSRLFDKEACRVNRDSDAHHSREGDECRLEVHFEPPKKLVTVAT